MSILSKAQTLLLMAQNARAAGDIAASIELALAAAQYLRLSRILQGESTAG